MCQIIVSPAGKEINEEYLDKAQVHNQDGYGVAWYEDKQVKTYKTMNYITFKHIVKALTEYSKIVHLRYNTVGDTTIENCHPFDVPNGVMFHNGTINSLRPSFKEKGSDSKALAALMNECGYEYISDVEPLLQHIIGDKINKLAFLEEDGTVTIVNEHLGIEEDGIWYSNDYHLKDEDWCRGGCKPKKITKKANKALPKSYASGKDIKKHAVFVYGTLKRGYGNHNYHLKDAVFLVMKIIQDIS